MHTRTALGLVALLLSVATLAGLDSIPAQDSAAGTVPIEEATIDDFAWIAGRWTVQQDEREFLEETWNAPMANSMIGMFRWQRGDRIWLYEFMMIEHRRGEGIWFHLRHIAPKGVSWEAKDAPLSYPLAKLGDNEAVFEDPEKNQPRRFIFRRDGESLTVRLEGYVNGELDVNEFKYALAE